MKSRSKKEKERDAALFAAIFILVATFIVLWQHSPALAVMLVAGIIVTGWGLKLALGGALFGYLIFMGGVLILVEGIRRTMQLPWHENSTGDGGTTEPGEQRRSQSDKPSSSGEVLGEDKIG